MKRRLTSVVAIAAVVAGAGAFEAQAADFNVANVVVYRVGAGAVRADTATPVFLNEYTPTCPASTLVQSVALPTSIVGSNRRLTANGTDPNGGLLTRSSNGRFLLATGYNAATGTTVAGTTAAAVNRVVGRIDKTAAIDTTTAFSDAYDNGGLYGATSTNGTHIWTTGNPTGNVRYATLGSTTSTQLVSAGDFYNGVGIFGNQLYVAGSALATVGTGTPMTGGQTSTALPGVDLTTPRGFVFFDRSSAVVGLDTVYVASRDSDNGGLRKYSLVAGTWTSNGTVGSGSDGYVGVTGSGNGSGVTLFVTSGGALVRLVDTSGYNGAFAGTPTVCATPATNTAFRGVALAPIAATAVGWRGGEAVAGNRGVLVTWRAGRDAENLGFDVLRARRGATRRVKVTRKLIAGTALSTKAGSSGSLRFRDRRGKAGDRYFVVARATDGTKRVHGPLVARSSTRKAAR